MSLSSKISFLICYLSLLIPLLSEGWESDRLIAWRHRFLRLHLPRPSIRSNGRQWRTWWHFPRPHRVQHTTRCRSVHLFSYYFFPLPQPFGKGSYSAAQELFTKRCLPHLSLGVYCYRFLTNLFSLSTYLTTKRKFQIFFLWLFWYFSFLPSRERVHTGGYETEEMYTSAIYAYRYLVVT